MKDDNGKWVLTKGKYYVYTWSFGEYKKTIYHTENYLPELDIQSEFSKFGVFCNRVG